MVKSIDLRADDAEMSPGKILVIEDEPSNSLLVKVTLRPLECETMVRSNGIAGLDAARSGDIELIVLDIALPGMDGWKILEEIRKDPDTMMIPVLVLTAHAGEESMMRAADAGADAFIGKPFHPKELRHAVRTLIDRRRHADSAKVGQ